MIGIFTTLKDALKAEFSEEIVVFWTELEKFETTGHSTSNL